MNRSNKQKTRPRKRPTRSLALSGQERARVEANLDLVDIALRRYRRRCRSRRAADENPELAQEGFLALMLAVRSHDSKKHDDFASFALSRIRYAMSRFAHEQHPLIRVPFITQRRRKRLPGESADVRPLSPHAFSLSFDERILDRGFTDTRNAASAHSDTATSNADRTNAATLAELVRHQYEVTMDRIVKDMLATRRCTAQARGVIRRCRNERWSIPEPTERTPIRQLASELQCSPGCITHCESTFREKLAGALRTDTLYRWLRRTARRHPRGWEHTLTHEELDSLLKHRRKRRSQPHRKPRRPTPPGCRRSRDHSPWEPNSQP